MGINELLYTMGFILHYIPAARKRKYKKNKIEIWAYGCPDRTDYIATINKIKILDTERMVYYKSKIFEDYINEMYELAKIERDEKIAKKKADRFYNPKKTWLIK